MDSDGPPHCATGRSYALGPWELGQVIQRGYASKLIVLMLELSRFKRVKISLTRRVASLRDITTARVDAIREAFSGSAWDAALSELSMPEQIRGLAFGPGGNVVAICARSRSRETYQIAARI